MKTLRDYMVETEQWLQTPAVGDDFAIELDDGTLIEPISWPPKAVLCCWMPHQKFIRL